MEDCVFCKIANGEIPCHKIWESDTHLAFLDIKPAVEGMTLVIPKKHHTSYFVELEDEVLLELIKAAKEVAKLLDAKLENVLRTKLVLEGLDVDHTHVKLYPMYIRGKEPEKSKDLGKLAEKIRGETK